VRVYAKHYVRQRQNNLTTFFKFNEREIIRPIVIKLNKNEEEIYVALQLKHKEKINKKITVKQLKASSQFSLEKYYEAYKGLDETHKQFQFILFTNALNGLKLTTDHKTTKIIETSTFTIIEDSDHEKDIVKLFNTSSEVGNVYRFEANPTTSNEGKNNTRELDYKVFLSRVRLFVCQKDLMDLEKDMIEILEKNAALGYIDFFRKWHRGAFENKTIEKRTVNVHLVEIFLSSHIETNRYFLFGQNEKLKLFEKIMKEFDVTLVHDSFELFAKNLTKDFNPAEGIEEELERDKKLHKIDTDDERIMTLAKENKLIGRSVTVLEDKVKLKVFQYIFGKPIIIKFNETSENLIYKIMELHQLGSKIKFILVGQGIQSDRLSRRFRIFENVNDLRSNDELYSEVTRTCRLSLQGRKETTLEKLIDSCEEISKHVKAKEVLQMLEGQFLIGQATESPSSSFHINRKVSFKVEKIDAILDAKFFKKYLPVVKFDRKIRKIQNEIRKSNINVVDVHDYLEATQISNDPTIISTNEECSEQLLKDDPKKSYNKSVVHLRISEDNGFLIISINEDQIYCLTRRVNILCGDGQDDDVEEIEKRKQILDDRCRPQNT
jgi:hypothetical protein